MAAPIVRITVIRGKSAARSLSLDFGESEYPTKGRSTLDTTIVLENIQTIRINGMAFAITNRLEDCRIQDSISIEMKDAKTAREWKELEPNRNSPLNRPLLT